MVFCNVNVERIKHFKFHPKKYEIKFVGAEMEHNDVVRRYTTKVGNKIVDIMIVSQECDYYVEREDIEFLQTQLKERYG